jgi:hypothetical protein
LHAMIDIETLDTRPTSVILSIGIIAFNPETGWIDSGGGIEIFPDRQEQMDEGRTMSWDTVAWWLQQSEEARKNVTRPRGGFDKREKVLTVLHDYWNRMNCKYVWGHGPAFDISLVEDYLKYTSIPWKFYNVRCTRTMWHYSPVEKTATTAHTALADATEQAQRIITSWRNKNGHT